MRRRNKKKIFLISAFFLLAAVAGGAFLIYKNKTAPTEEIAPLPPAPAENDSFSGVLSIPSPENTPKPPPPPVDMKRLKTQGCVADGLLTEYNPDQGEFINLINRSNCYYLHRAVETWLAPPDFEVIQKNIAQVGKNDVVYGMFLAEALDKNANYRNDSNGKEFSFSRMCHKGSDNAWGEHTCQPAFSSEKYRDYLKYVTRRAIDIGVQSFMFGQIQMQEGAKTKYASRIARDIRKYAKRKGVDIVIGAQTGSITDEKYLKIFDYIEGGVGIDGAGNIESGPCLSGKGSCWGLLWNKAFSGKAKNVLLHLDWTGILSDDLDIFARMDGATRARTLEKLYKYFTSRNMGFLMPFFGVLDTNNGGCFGPKRRYYSPSDAYSCKDEDAINKILGGKT